MRRCLSVVVSVAVAAAGLVMAGESTAAATSVQCLYTPKLPAKVSVGQTVVGMRVPVTITAKAGAACGANFDASVSLVHGNDSYLLAWDNADRTDRESVYAFEIVPGTYRTAGDSDCLSLTANYENRYSCAVASAHTVIKFAGRVGLAAKRLTGKNKHKVKFSVHARRYSDYGKGYLTDTVRIQRYSGGKWHTIHKATAHGAKGYTWTYTKKAKAKYRAVSSETAKSFAGTSKTVTK